MKQNETPVSKRSYHPGCPKKFTSILQLPLRCASSNVRHSPPKRGNDALSFGTRDRMESIFLGSRSSVSGMPAGLGSCTSQVIWDPISCFVHRESQKADAPAPSLLLIPSPPGLLRVNTPTLPPPQLGLLYFSSQRDTHWTITRARVPIQTPISVEVWLHKTQSFHVEDI